MKRNCSRDPCCVRKAPTEPRNPYLRIGCTAAHLRVMEPRGGKTQRESPEAFAFL